MTEAKPQPGPFAVESVGWDDWAEGTRFGGRVRVLSDTRKGGMKIGVSIEELPPGKQSCPFHFHMVEEEHMLILEGQATLRLGEARHLVKAGDFVSFRAGEASGHCLINESDAPCRFLMIGDNSPNEVCVYPDSGKMAVNALKKVLPDDVFDMTATRDYWDGENKDG